MPHSLLAVEGQLNYGFETPQNTTIIEDTTKIDVCNKRLTESQAQFTNCQKSSSILQRSLDAKNKTILSQQQLITVLVVIVSILSILFLLALIKYFSNKHKITPTTSLITPPPNAA